MAGSLFTYSGLVTKTKAMESKLLRQKDFERLVMIDSVSDMITFLKQQDDYRDIFANVDENHIHRGQIEHILMNSLYLDYAKLFRFARRKQRKSISILFFRYEVNILKTCIQSVKHQENFAELSTFREFFERHSDLDLEQLIHAETMEDLLHALEKTKYAAVVKSVMVNPEATIFDYEMQLDIFYFQSVWKMKDTWLDGDEKEAFTHLIGSQIDLLNILWIYRMKTYYKMDSTKIYGRIIPIHYQLTNAKLMSLVEAITPEEIFSILEKSHYRQLSSLEDVSQLENYYRKILNEISHKNRKKHPMSIASVHYFLLMKEQEIDRLTTTLECIRYQLSPEESLEIILQ